MTGSFANLYWSSDYKTGMGQLSRQSTRSLGQLHELRQLVFQFMNYFHSNSEHMNRLAIDSYSLESGFRKYDGEKDLDRLPLPKRENQTLKRLSDTFKPKKRVVSGQAQVEALVEKDLGLQVVDMGGAFEYFVKYMTEESHLLTVLARQIDREILESITTFIKIHEPQIHGIIGRFNDLVEDYESKFKELEKLKLDYDECLRLGEFVKPQVEKAIEKDVLEETESDEDLPKTDDSIESEFNFPLIIGPLKISTAPELSDLLGKLIQSTPLIKRKITLPGSRDEIFVSGDLCNYLKRNRPLGMNPSAVNLERFGQTLIDLKLIVGTGFWSKKFKTEDMWFEWSDLALYVSQFDGRKNGRQVPSVVVDDTSKYVNGMAQNTSKKFNNMFQNVQKSLRKYSPEMIPEIERQYNEGYLDLQETKYLIDVEIMQSAQTLENFEVKKIEIIYQSLTKLLEILYNSSLSSTGKLHTLATDFIDKVNLSDNYNRDFDKLIEDFSTGIYFPSNVSPENLLKKQYNTSQTNNSFQNIKSQFNLFKDIPLQLLLNSDDSLSILSLPIFLYELIKLIETKDIQNFDKYWASPINHQSYWMLKEKLIETINSYEIQNHLEITQENIVHQQILKLVLNSLQDSTGEDLINLLKNWLLQTSDSLIPCMVYDQVIFTYKKYLSEDQSLDSVLRKNELLKHLATISRSNLSSLVYVLEHISKTFDLQTIPTYQKEDAVPEIEHFTDSVKLGNAVGALNSMEYIGAVPFIHLLLRPSSAKSSSGFKPPAEIYNVLLTDLLQIETRAKLLSLLLEHENLYKAKKERENAGLQIKKLPVAPKLPTLRPRSQSPARMPTRNNSLKSPQPVSGEFTLRPFRTKITPAPSPATSPINPQFYTANNSVDSISSEVPTRKSSTKKRSGSVGLALKIAVEFEEE